MTRELKTGIVAVVIIALFIWGYNFLKGQDIFSANSRYFYVEYTDISGLNVASTVTINGLKVGKVDEILLNSKPSKKGQLLVKFTINSDFKFTKNSVAKIYPASLMGGKNIAIIPSYSGDEAISGDFLKGEVEGDLIASISNQITPKLENMIVSVDSLVTSINDVLDKEKRESLKNSISGLESTITNINASVGSVRTLLADSKEDIRATTTNTKKITENFAQLSDDLKKANLGNSVKKLETTLASVDTIMTNIKNGKGTLGKLATDEQLYINLTKSTQELEELLREMKLNPKRFVHFSLFGKRADPYNEETNKKNVSNNK